MKLWVEKLIEEYREGQAALEKYRQKLDRTNPEEKLEFEIIGGMISDMEFAMEWMRRGRRPGNRRGIDRQDAYLRASLMDMDRFPSLEIEPSKSSLTYEQKRKIVSVLLELSERERQTYILHMTYGMSYSEIAEELILSRRTVQQYVERAKLKIAQFIA